MSFLDDLLELFFGDVNWQQRLKKTITFISPEGNEFEGLWRGSPRSMNKKLAIFEYPRIAGNVVQDLDVNSAMYPIPFSFEGLDNDTQANNFFAACKQRGQWEIIHPVHGFLGLQLMSVQEMDAPIESGNITAINTVWIEPIDEATLKTAREMAGIIDGQINDLDTNVIEDFVNAVNAATEGLKNAIESTTQGISNVTDFLMSPLTVTVDSVDTAFNAIQDGITDTLNSTVLQTEQLAAQIQNLIELPALASNDLEARTDRYGDLFDEFLTQLPGGDNSRYLEGEANDRSKNSVATSEVAASAVLSGWSKSVITTPTDSQDKGTLQTSLQAIEQANKIIKLSNDLSDAFEAVQTSFNDKDIDDQYFAQQTSFENAALLASTVAQYLLATSFDLKIEKRFILDRPRTPIDIAIQEYGNLGENDFNLDFFIQTNDLKGNDILLLPAGREVLIYA